MTSEVLAYSVNGACKAIGCGRTKLYQLISEGRLEAKKLDNKTIITRASAVRLVDELPDAGIGKAPKGGASKTEPAAAAAP